MLILRHLLLACLVFTSKPAKAETPLIIYGDDNHPPYSYIDDNGKPAGIYTQIVQTILSQMSETYKTEIKLTPWKRAVTYMQKGRGFALFPPHYFPEKRPFLKPYSLPILEEQPVLFCNPSVETDKRAKWPIDYRDLKIGISAGVKMGGKPFWDLVSEGKIEIEESLSIRENLLKLIKGRIHCHINDRTTISWYLHQLGKKGHDVSGIFEATRVSNAEHGYLALSTKHHTTAPFREEFIEQFNKILKELQENGDLQRIIAVHLSS